MQDLFEMFGFLLPNIEDKYLKMEREQHGNTWDSAIKAHEDRGHVISRSITDFDDYKIK